MALRLHKAVLHACPSVSADLDNAFTVKGTSQEEALSIDELTATMDFYPRQENEFLTDVDSRKPMNRKEINL
jgi:hypothetical protein